MIVFKNKKISSEIKNSNDEYQTVTIKSFENEIQLLNYFKICFSNADPDLIIGHEIISSFLEFIYLSLKSKGIDTFFLGKFS